MAEPSYQYLSIPRREVKVRDPYACPQGCPPPGAPQRWNSVLQHGDLAVCGHGTLWRLEDKGGSYHVSWYRWRRVPSFLKIIYLQRIGGRRFDIAVAAAAADSKRSDGARR